MIRLCSASPTRALILKENNIAFVQSQSDFDEEQIRNQDPKTFVFLAAKGKFESCLRRYGFNIPLLAADTVVAVRDKILRKAATKEEARELLLSQSGQKVSIITCMIYKSERVELTDISVTDYLFDPFNLKELEIYLDSGEWKGKAGACMVEGFCKNYIREVRGLDSCARGLTIEKLRPFL